MRKVIVNNFKGTQQSFLVKDVDQINPYIVRFLKSIYQVQVNHLFEKYENAMRSYLGYLMQFANLCVEFRQCQAYLDFGLDKIEVNYSQAPLIESTVDIKVVHTNSTEEDRLQRKNTMRQSNRMLGGNIFKQAIRALKPSHA